MRGSITIRIQTAPALTYVITFPRCLSYLDMLKTRIAGAKYEAKEVQDVKNKHNNQHLSCSYVPVNMWNLPKLRNPKIPL